MQTGEEMEFRKVKFIGLTCLMAVGLSACGGVLEWDNADIKGGKIYRIGDDKPFSGEATNVPANVLARPLAPLSKAVNSVHAVINGDGSFSTNLGVAMMFDQSKLCTVDLSKGTPDGSISCFYANTDVKFFSSKLKDGVVDGDIELFAKNGTRYAVYPISNGVVDGTVTQWFTDKPDSKVFEVSLDSDFKNGSFETFWPDGKTKKKITAQDGKIVEESNFDEAGLEFWSERQANEWFKRIRQSDDLVLTDEQTRLVEDAASRYRRDIPLSPRALAAKNDRCLSSLTSRIKAGERINYYDIEKGMYPDLEGCYGDYSYFEGIAYQIQREIEGSNAVSNSVEGAASGN